MLKVVFKDCAGSVLITYRDEALHMFSLNANAVLDDALRELQGAVLCDQSAKAETALKEWHSAEIDHSYGHSVAYRHQ